MNRTEWKEMHRRLRSAGGMAVRSEHIMHGGTYWTIHHVPAGSDRGLDAKPSIIRDRPMRQRIADMLDWARCYRADAKRHKRNGSYFESHAMQACEAARLCIADARALREGRSAFQTL